MCLNIIERKQNVVILKIGRSAEIFLVIFSKLLTLLVAWFVPISDSGWLNESSRRRRRHRHRLVVVDIVVSASSSRLRHLRRHRRRHRLRLHRRRLTSRRYCHIRRRGKRS